MHELSIALSLLDAAAEEAGRQRARVVALHVRLGPLSGVVPEALRSAYELAREGSPLIDAELRIEEISLVIRCPVCAVDRPGSVWDLRRPVCGGPADVISGRELELFALELEA